MPDLTHFRAGKPPFYPDQAVHAAFVAAACGLDFRDIDGGTGLLFEVASGPRTVTFGAGRCSFYPQNNATAASLAADKYFADRVLARAGVASLGGNYFFLDPRRRAHRPPGHEREDALALLAQMGAAFVKPLNGSRGDFARTISGAADFAHYLDEVADHYDAIIMQPVWSGDEHRLFLLDGELIYAARKTPPAVTGDGVRSLRALLAAHDRTLAGNALSPVVAWHEAALDRVPAAGEDVSIAGRTNLSAGGTMQLVQPSPAAVVEARRAMQALGLRAGAVDLFDNAGGVPGAVRIIEVNANPSILFLERIGGDDLILKIWRHAFVATGLLDV